MKLFSEVPIQQPDFQIQYSDNIFCLGSCFVSEIGNKLQQSKFNTLVNPFGTQFHPLALENVFSRIYTRTFYNQNEIFHYKELNFSWDHSYYFSKPKIEDTLQVVNEGVEEGNSFITSTDVFIFTLGTAWAYRLRDASIFVSNCHKVPQKHFDKVLLSFDQIYQSMMNLIMMVHDVRPSAQIIFTISPVRHFRDGYRENHVSKGLLHQVLHEILQDYRRINYFPSYEIVMDELRDYRYYADDFVHLNELGINYIWDKFRKVYFTDESQALMKEVSNIIASLNHKPINPEGLAHKKFLYDTLKKLQTLVAKLPNGCFDTEIKELKNRIHAY